MKNIRPEESKAAARNIAAPKILECTLRDGSYAIDFQFTDKDTYRIAKCLDDLGFPLIEIGHGLGLGASEMGHGKAAASDEEYMIAASKAVKNGKWGMFCIPGIARLSDIDLAADYGMGFVRIGTEVDNVESGRPFIERALAKGIEVYCNLMKSYTADPGYFAEQANKCFDYGASCVYIVDSAGGMLPHEIKTYSDALRALRPDANIGFHGHNNLGMAAANGLYAAEEGFYVVDTSLQGMGRSAGNTGTEHFISLLSRARFVHHYDAVDVMQAGEELTRHLIVKRDIKF
jgi:4-hydroxy-2-oxovalerate aldolase